MTSLKQSALGFTAAITLLAVSYSGSAAASSQDVVTSSALAAQTSAQAADAGPDAARILLVKHVMKLSTNGKSTTLDGKKLKAVKLFNRNGNYYVPLHVLQDSGVAKTASWDAKKKEIHLVMNPSIGAGYQEIKLRVGSDRVYDMDGTVFPATMLTVPKPFVSGGTVYVPVKPLRTLGVSVSIDKGYLTWAWSEKQITVTRSKWDTNQDKAEFTVLFAKGTSPASGVTTVLGGSSGAVEGSVQIGGQFYNRVTLYRDLVPGPNSVQIIVGGKESAVFEITRHVTDPSAVPVIQDEYGQMNLSLSAPASGFVQLKAGESLEVNGKILKTDDLYDQVSVDVQKYQPSGQGWDYKAYKDLGKTSISIKDQAITGSIKFKEPGFYQVVINSPKYMNMPDIGLSEQQWARLTVEVK